MSFYFILTTSAFVNWSSDLDSDIIKATRKLFDKLKIISLMDKESRIVVVEETGNTIKNVLDTKELWVHEFVKEYYTIEQNTPGKEIEAVTNLALKKCELFDTVIIINGSNIYEEQKIIAQKQNILVMNELKALTYIIRNCSL